ncbi:MAG: S-layer homology domain-containing protein [Actinomycetota bacterium]
MDRSPRRRRWAAAALIAALATTVTAADASSDFGDVQPDDYFAEAVQWLVDEEITVGVSDGCFGPDEIVTRGQFATFLWRWAGRLTGSAHPFVDVADDRFYADPVRWLWTTGITTGTSPTTFSPDDQLTRGHIATFLWRHAGRPAAPVSDFVDVERHRYFAVPIDWMVANEITTGTSATTFDPERPVTRAEFAAFLHRYADSPPVAVDPGGHCVATGERDLGADVAYTNDFSTAADGDRLDQFVAYRDPFVVNHTTGSSDHASTGGVGCTSPDITRPQTRDQPVAHVYQCLPGDNAAMGHQMAYAMDTSGYGFVGALPDQVFRDVSEVAVDINTTSAGTRNFVEIKVLPADQVFADAMPCIPDLPCNDGWDYDDIGGVGAGTMAQDGTGLVIATPDRPDGYAFDRFSTTPLPGGDIRFEPCSGGGFCFDAIVHEGNEDVRARYRHVLRDDGEGTLSFGIERVDGTFAWVEAPGAFPTGEVRIVVSFHTYTGTKDGQGPAMNDSNSTGGFTWHWDDLTVLAGDASPSATWNGGASAERIVTPDGCVAFAQGQRSAPNNTDIAPMLHCAGDPPVG